MSVEGTYTRMPLTRLLELEPRAQRLLDEAAAVEATGPEWCQHGAYFDLKQEIRSLVGFDSDATHPELQGTEAYDCLIHAVLERLPRCRHTSWVCPG